MSAVHIGMERALRAAQRSVDAANAAVNQYLLQQKATQLDLRVSLATSRASQVIRSSCPKRPAGSRLIV